MDNINYIEKFHEQMINMIKNEHSNNCLHIGSIAPKFTAETTFGECSLDDYKGKWLILFSHPRRFYTKTQ